MVFIKSRSKEPRICLVANYFGKLPGWFPAYLLSCNFNSDIDWLITSDQSPPPDLPPNVRWIHNGISDFSKLVSRKLNIKYELDPSQARKIVDLKPAFGKVFEDFLSGYDYWGHSDVDIIWGRIRHGIQGPLSKGYDIISSRIKKIGGHFTIYRNTPYLSSLFKDIPGYLDEILIIPDILIADEKQWTQLLRRMQGRKYRLKQLLFHFRKPVSVYWEKHLTTPGRMQNLVSEADGRVFKFKDGVTYGLDGEELMYVHFHLLKETIRNIDLAALSKDCEIVISENRIYAKAA